MFQLAIIIVNDCKEFITIWRLKCVIKNKAFERKLPHDFTRFNLAFAKDFLG